MNERKRPTEKRRCPAMISEGIYDPESADGINFCLDYCPYENCVVFEGKFTVIQIKSRSKRSLAKALRARRVSVDDIALILGKSVRQTLRYLKK